MTMELRHVNYFLALAEEKHFTRAAERSGIQQPPFSRQIRDLEEMVGARLFTRAPNGTFLTEAGRAFQSAVQNIPNQIERATRDAQRAARGEVGSLRVGYTGSAGFHPVVSSAIRSFRRNYPEVDLSLEEANTPRLVEGIKDGSYDVGFLRPGASGSAELQERLLVEEAMVAVLPADHPLSAAEKVKLARLKDEPFILLPPSSGPILHDEIYAACRSAGFEPTLGQMAPQIGSVINLVATGLGVSLVPECMRCLQVPGVVFRSLAGKGPIARLAVSLRRGESAVTVRNFNAECKRQLGRSLRAQDNSDR
jgi:DNA-binding transcriptional LysR family regulator